MNPRLPIPLTEDEDQDDFGKFDPSDFDDFNDPLNF
jgi:hypothetical protein